MAETTRAIHTFQEGELFDGRYRLVKRVGSGGFADVWKAEDTQRKNKVVALKIYTRLDEDGIQSMSDEYDQTEDIRHPNLLTGNHFAVVGNIPYMEMTYCDGGSLASRIGKMTVEELRHMLCDVCSGLAYLHGEGIVHQDIKPENILFDGSKRRYLLSDFGISEKSRSRLSKSVKMAQDAVSMTLAYAPPERFSSNPTERQADPKSDIFSLGITVYELATGLLPFDPSVNTGDRMLEKHGNVDIYYDGIADPQLRRIEQRCMAYRKEDRPTDSEVLAMMEAGGGEPVADSKEQTASGGKPKTVKVKTGGGDTSSGKQEPSKSQPEGSNPQSAPYRKFPGLG